MIQRIQTIWLLAAAILFGLEYLPNLNIIQTSSSGEGAFTDSVFHASESLPSTLGMILSAGLCIISIFLFNQRKLQMGLANLGSLLQIILTLAYPLYQCFLAGKGAEFRPALGSLLGLAGVIFILLATRAIQKDEKLVKSMDRLR